MNEIFEAVRSVERALSIIETLTRMGEVGITDLSRELGLGKATIYRLITTLRLHGYVEQTSADKYKLSLKLFELGSKVVNRLGVRNIAYPYLEELALITKETVNLAVLEQTNAVYIERIESREPLRMGLETGMHFPAYCSALGRALLAYRDPAEIDSLLNQAEREGQIQKHTKNTITDLESIKKELRKIKKNGYSLDEEQYLDGICGIAAPIFNYTGKVVAAVSVAGPTVRMTKKVAEEFTPIIKEAAQNISLRLGYTG